MFHSHHQRRDRCSAAAALTVYVVPDEFHSHHQRRDRCSWQPTARLPSGATVSLPPSTARPLQLVAVVPPPICASEFHSHHQRRDRCSQREAALIAWKLRRFTPTINGETAAARRSRLGRQSTRRGFTPTINGETAAALETGGTTSYTCKFHSHHQRRDGCSTAAGPIRIRAYPSFTPTIN